MQIDAPRVLQMRLVVEADDYDEAVRFFRDVLGLREEGSFSGPATRASRSSTPGEPRSRSRTRPRSG